MEKKIYINYAQQYKDLGISICPLPDNYSPDSYAMSLISDMQKPQPIAYANNTDYRTKKLEKELI